MNETAWLQGLDRLAERGQALKLWLRDDDAVEVTPALERLLALTEEYQVPITLAVIPENTGFQLAKWLEGKTGFSVAVHGWSHRSYSKPPAKKQELGDDRPLPVVLNELQAGLQKLKALHGERALPMLVPPWNRISPTITSALSQCGYRALSVFGREKENNFPLINTHIDLIDWHGTRGGRQPEAVFSELNAYLEQPVACLGILTHHLVHDDAAWNLLERILKHTTNHPACVWHSASELVA